MRYENLTDDELIREADGQGGLIKALSERLEMRQSFHMTAFEEQAFFMRACGQTTNVDNYDQAELYDKLRKEETMEFLEARFVENEVEEFDAVLDLIVVLIGYGLSRGWPMDEGWAEVMRSNMAKIDPYSGTVRRREDGKILKPEGWTPPNLADLINPAQRELF
jgi:predicted HAD superfamily Cof-like phosphohydrolase